MPDRTQDLTNHRKVATACKNYTDNQVAQAKEDILWHIGEYSVSTSDDNTTASTKTVPSNATRCKIKRIYGYTQKFNPTTASDSTAYSVKTMPATVYDFDVSKVEGASEVSENLIVFDDVAETTINGVKVKYQDGAVYLDGTSSEQFKVVVQFKQPIYANQDYYVKLFTSGTTTATNPKAIGETSTDVRLLVPSTTTFNVAYNINYFWFSVGNGTVWTNYVVKPMIVKGTTEPTVWKKGFNNIHNLELSGLKVEGANIFTGTWEAQTNAQIVSSTNESLKVNRTQISNSFAYKTISLKAGTYTLSFNSDGYCTYQISTESVVLSITGNVSKTFTISEDTQVIFNFTTANNNTQISITNIMLNYGNTAKTYADYVAPTTLPIDLSTILYNGNPLFEGNSLKGVGTAKDYITPYKAHKGIMKKVFNDASSENWQTQYGLFYCSITDYDFVSYAVKFINNLYTEIAYHGSLSDFINSGDKIITITEHYVYVKDTSIENLSDFKTYLSNNNLILQYALKTPIEVSIDWSSTLRGITGYSNGTITLLNTNNQDTSNLITYNSIIKENCCAKMVQSRGGSVIATVNFPTQASDGWSAGSVNNVRDLTTSKRGTNVSTYDLGLGTYSYTTSTQTPTFETPRPSNSKSNSTNLLCAIYDVEASFWNIPNNYFKIYIGSNNINISNSNYTNTTIFKTAHNGEILYYELADASKTETSIDAVENIIEVQAGDELAFYDSNDNLVTVPSDLTYRIEVAN